MVFQLALAFINLVAVVSSFVRRLTDFAPWIGLGNAIFIGGALLPQFPAAHLANSRLCSKPYVGTPPVFGQDSVLDLRVGSADGFGYAHCGRVGSSLCEPCLIALGDSTVVVAWGDTMARNMSIARSCCQRYTESGRQTMASAQCNSPWERGGDDRSAVWTRALSCRSCTVRTSIS